MWLFTNFGFFSAVQKHGQNDLTIRARAAGDLEQLREQYLPELSLTTSQAGTDYPFRARVSHAAFAEAARKIALDINYNNFKSEVGKRMGSDRAHAYSDVWHALLQLENEQPVRRVETWPEPANRGGVVGSIGHFKCALRTNRL